jgi:hypothetical protein
MAFRARKVARALPRLDAAEKAIGTDRVPGEELPRSVGLVVVGPKSLWPGHLRPARPAFGFDGQRSELVEGDGPVPFVLEQVLDAGELLLASWIGRLLPGLGALEGDVGVGQDLAEPLS